MIKDTELEAWQHEWRSQTGPLPELKKKIKRQNRRTMAAITFLCACLAFSTVYALRTRGSLLSGFAAGLWFSSLCAGSYIWWVGRGTWKPAAQTTLAYVELAHKRAVAKVRTLHFCSYFLLATILVFAAMVAWNWKTFAVGRDVALIAAMGVELLVFAYAGRRKKKEVEETRKLMGQIQEETNIQSTKEES